MPQQEAVDKRGRNDADIHKKLIESYGNRLARVTHHISTYKYLHHRKHERIEQVSHQQYTYIGSLLLEELIFSFQFIHFLP